MADRVMRAVALIEAQDKASQKFEAFGKKIGEVERKMKLVEAASAKMNAAMGKGADVANLTRARDVLTKSRETVTRLKTEFEAAQAQAKALAQAMKTGGSAATYDKATASVRRLAAELDRANASHDRVKTHARRAMKEFAASKDAATATGGGVDPSSGGGGGLKSMGAAAAVGAAARGGVAAKTKGMGRFVPTSITPAGLAAAVTVAGAKHAHDVVADAHHEFQRATLKQQAVLDIDPEAQKSLQTQAVKIGQDTKFTNADIVRAQTDIGGKLPKNFQSPATIAAITEATKNYAIAMEVSMQDGGEAVVGWMKSRGYDLSTPQLAAKSAARAANQMVTLAKTSGAKHHDLIGDTKFGAAPGRVAGYSEEFSNALSAQLIRIGYEGAMAGNFVRGSAMRLSAPSQKGMAAIAASGLNYFDYVKPGADPSAEGLDKIIKQKFGRSMSKEALGRVREALNDDEIKSDPATFISSISEILNDTFAKKTKKGTVNAQDAERIAKAVNDFFVLSSKGVDVERLMTDLIRRGMPPALAKHLFGQEHGGRAQAINPEQLEKDKKVFQNVPEDRAKKSADKMQEGAQGAYQQMQGSIETFNVALGESTDGLRSFTYKGIAGLFDVLTKVVKGERTESTEQVKPLDWSKNKDRILENAERDRKEFRRDPEAYRGRAFSRIGEAAPTPRFDDPSGPEAARGRAMQQAFGGGKLEATVKPDQITAKAEVSGETTVKVPVTVTVNDGAVKGLIRAEVLDQMGKMRIQTNGAGSTGRSSPDAE